MFGQRLIRSGRFAIALVLLVTTGCASHGGQVRTTEMTRASVALERTSIAFRARLWNMPVDEHPNRFKFVANPDPRSLRRTDVLTVPAPDYSRVH